MASTPPKIYVLAGVNGSGKSSIGGAAIRAAGAAYFNPDEAAAKLRQLHPLLDQALANSTAWQIGKQLLERAIAERKEFAFESTLGANTMTTLLITAAKAGFEVHIWYAGLDSPERNIARVRQRVSRGGHDISEAAIRKRYETSRLNLIKLLPHVTSLRVFDNSAEEDPHSGVAPLPVLVLEVQRGVIVAVDLTRTPQWAKPIVVAAMRQFGAD
jgi:predicted ABC-type ATPase